MSREKQSPLVVGGVVRDVLDPFTATTELRVMHEGRMVYNGSHTRPSHVARRPRVEIGGHDDFRTFYTLVMVDADSPNPSEPSFRELVTDIPGSTDAGFGREIVSYESPEPSLGIHRLVLVLFLQPKRQMVNAPEQRKNFNTREFSQSYNLGSPVAAVFYNCQRENGTGCRRA
ncbi:hypothetical protein BUALT_Bualt03G0025600 [Buddleja alternifolia]|uniref:Uncharacterized protein n=1 Tax=Buddleja alternifolia TaxID=168488 RepID=A0AAV6XV03_9LAMI|nr:hypothetical protein BUALT_Bualt03G0025600 [Buddleja alternifolia]